MTNLANGRSLVVRVNDRGPYHGNRVMDVSVKAAHLLNFHRHGTARVLVEYLGPAPIEGSDDRVHDAPPSLAAAARVVPLDMDQRVFLFTLIVAGLATLMFALLPALHGTRVPLTSALRGERASGAHGSRLRNALVISQVAVSLVLIIVAATLVRMDRPCEAQTSDSIRMRSCRSARAARRPRLTRSPVPMRRSCPARRWPRSR